MNMTELRNVNLLEEGGTQPNKIVGQVAYDLLAKEVFTSLKEKADKVHRHTADDVDDSATKRIPTIVKQTEWDAKVSEEKLREEIGKLTSGLAWKGVFQTKAELSEKIPTPKEGDFVIVTQEPSFQNKNTILIYEAEQVNEWQSVDALFMPDKVTQTTDGLMSKEDKKKLDGITDEKLVSAQEKQKWNEAHTKATANEQALGNKADKSISINVGNGLQGGGNLTQNRTISLKLAGDSIVADNQGLKVNVVDALNSTSATQSLSANQGKVLNEKITSTDAKVDKNAQELANKMTEVEATAIINKYKNA